MPKHDPHWEAKLQRPHRRIALFCLIQCWIKGADGLVFDRDDLKTILERQHIEQSLINQFSKNMREFFPHFVSIWSPQTTLVACFVSRRRMRGIPRNQPVRIHDQITQLKKQGVRIERFAMWRLDDSKTPLTALKTHLLSLARGGISNVPPMGSIPLSSIINRKTGAA